MSQPTEDINTKAAKREDDDHGNHLHANPANTEQTTTTTIPFEPIQRFRFINHFPPVEPWNTYSRLTGECGSAIQRLHMKDVARMPLEAGVDPRNGSLELTLAIRQAIQPHFVGYARSPTLKQTFARASEQHLINRSNGTTERLPPWIQSSRAGMDNRVRTSN
ncbi:hypothetical protein LTR84_000454 [Exophiala bonariae]|uniref:Uncharacterized protein n=1 Tax=Exophiala bonariae TaxID=1690606 RepID=A0AAV9NUL4_9EURO|nr:hypothetical protein LTR84_000454 [Exophiala bonariae]